MARRNKQQNGFERLKAINPVDESEVEGPDSPRAQHLLTTITSTRHGAPPQKRALTRRLRPIFAVLVAVLATTAAAWIWTRTISTPNSVSCYEAVDLGADIAAAPPGGSATADACVSVWERAELSNPEVALGGTVPPLTACVAENGSIAVFPTDDTNVCNSLGLAYPEPGSQDSTDTIRDVEDQLVAYFQSMNCIPLGEAETEVRRILDQSGLTTWTVQTQSENEDRPCASFSYEPASEIVRLVPIPDD